jgi:electron transport complex protein RnfG
MKEILKITASLTAVCVAASLILGAVYTQTFKARKHIEREEREEVIKGLLGFGHGKTTPSDLKVQPVHRYVVTDEKAGTLLGYVLPLKGDKAALLNVDLAGKPVKVIPINAAPGDLTDAGRRDKEVLSALGAGARASYAETFYVADAGDKRLGYVIPGVTQGFKTFIDLMVSLDPHFTLTGVAITKSEEDPGLGAEIKQNYFRNQFVGKTLDMLKTLEVKKDPLPADLAIALDPDKAAKAGMAEAKAKEVREQHVKDNIYALTGATISSAAVTRGVKDVVRKFVYRFNIVKKAIELEKIDIAF